MEKKLRIGIFGGTFNPPHLGHLILAMEACDQLQLDRLLWMLTPDPPHKLHLTITPVETRLELLKAAINHEPKFEISTLEMKRPAPQYAVDTIREVKERFPGVELYYLIGGDSLHDFPEWYHPRQIIDMTEGLGVMRRPGDQIDLSLLEQQLPGLTGKLRFVEAPLLEISSRQIRQRIAQGRAVKYYLPEPVFKLIEKLQLYKDEPANEN